MPCCVALRPRKLATLNVLWLWYPILFSGFLVVPCFASLGVLWHNALLGSRALCCAILCCAPRGRAKRAIVSVPSLTFCGFSLVFPCFSWVSVLSLAGSCCAPLRVPWHCVLCGSCMLCCLLLCRAAARASEASRREHAVFYILCLDIGFSCFSLVATLSLHASCFAPLGDLWHFVFCS